MPGAGLTEHSEPVVHGDDDDAAEAGEDAAVVRVARAELVRLAVDEEDHRQQTRVVVTCGERDTIVSVEHVGKTRILHSTVQLHVPQRCGVTPCV